MHVSDGTFREMPAEGVEFVSLFGTPEYLHYDSHSYSTIDIENILDLGRMGVPKLPPEMESRVSERLEEISLPAGR